MRRACGSEQGRVFHPAVLQIQRAGQKLRRIARLEVRHPFVGQTFPPVQQHNVGKMDAGIVPDEQLVVPAASAQWMTHTMCASYSAAHRQPRMERLYLVTGLRRPSAIMKTCVAPSSAGASMRPSLPPPALGRAEAGVASQATSSAESKRAGGHPRRGRLR